MATARRTYGYLYDRDRLPKEDAANMRRHIRTMVKAGLLPADWTYSVRFLRFAGGVAIDITACSPRPVFISDPRRRGMHEAWGDYSTHEAAAVYRTLNDLHYGHNHDGSDIITDYFDVKFYGTMTTTISREILVAYDYGGRDGHPANLARLLELIGSESTYHHHSEQVPDQRRTAEPGDTVTVHYISFDAHMLRNTVAQGYGYRCGFVSHIA